MKGIHAKSSSPPSAKKANAACSRLAPLSLGAALSVLPQPIF
jgi:hypothetical protein